MAICCLADASFGAATSQRAAQPQINATADREAIAQLMGQLRQVARGLRTSFTGFHAAQWQPTLNVTAALGNIATAPSPWIALPGKFHEQQIDPLRPGPVFSVRAHLVDLPPPLP